MEDLFVQFYQTYEKRLTSPGTFFEKGAKFHLLINGFSYIWNYANPIWIELDRAFQEIEPFDFSGYRKVYASAAFFEHAFIVVEWALKFPQVDFVVGGPAIRGLAIMKWAHKIPKNFHMTKQLAESIFELPLNPKRFKMVPPDSTIPKLYNFHIENGCYWGGCKFCCDNYSTQDVGFDLETLLNLPAGGVWLGTSAISPKNCNIFTQLNYSDKRYHCFIRGDSLTLEVFSQILSDIKEPTKLRFLMGVEYPSDRMLKIMNKGTDTKTMAKMITMLVGAGCKVTLSFLTSWGCLEKDDISKAAQFFRMLPDPSTYDAGYVKVQNLFNNIPSVMIESHYPFYNHLTDEQKQLDEEYKQVLNDFQVKCYESSKAKRLEQFLKFSEDKSINFE